MVGPNAAFKCKEKTKGLRTKANTAINHYRHEARFDDENYYILHASPPVAFCMPATRHLHLHAFRMDMTGFRRMSK